jgi:anti-sigma-K factor RskA
VTDESHPRHEDSAAAYLLGALPDLEQRAFERHVMFCATCRDEVERLRLVVAALPRSVVPLDAPAGLKRSIMAAVAQDVDSSSEAAETPRGEGLLARTRRRVASSFAGLRPATAAAGAAVLLAAGVLAGVGASEIVEGGSGEARIAAEVDHSRLAEGSGTLVVPEDEGSATLSVHGLPTLPDEQSTEIYQTWLVRGNEVIPSAVFSVNSEGAGAATIEEELEHVDAVWVTREAAGGSRAPTESPVMELDLG